MAEQPKTYGEYWDRYVESFGKSPSHAGLNWPGDEWGNADQWRMVFKTLFVAHLPADTGSAIEIGQGSGKYTEMFLETFPKATVIAADVSTRFLDILQKRCAALLAEGRLRIAQIGDKHTALSDAARANGVTPGTLDVMYSLDAMVHVDLQYLAAYWMSAKELLRPGGKIIMSVADATRQGGFEKLVRDIPDKFAHQGQQTDKFEWLCPELVTAVLGRMGFDVVDAMPNTNRDLFFVATKRPTA